MNATDPLCGKKNGPDSVVERSSSFLSGVQASVARSRFAPSSGRAMPPFAATAAVQVSSSAKGLSRRERILAPQARRQCNRSELRVHLTSLLWRSKVASSRKLIVILLNSSIDEIHRDSQLGSEAALFLAAALGDLNRPGDRQRALDLIRTWRSASPSSATRDHFNDLLKQINAQKSPISLQLVGPPVDEREVASLCLTLARRLSEEERESDEELALLKEFVERAERLNHPDLLHGVHALIGALRERNAPTLVPGEPSDLQYCLRLLERWIPTDPALARAYEWPALCQELQTGGGGRKRSADPIHVTEMTLRARLGKILQPSDPEAAFRILQPFAEEAPQRNDDFVEAVGLYAFLLAQRNREGDRAQAIQLLNSWVSWASNPLRGQISDLIGRVQSDRLDASFLFAEPRQSREDFAQWAGDLGSILWNTNEAPLAIWVLGLALANQRGHRDCCKWMNLLAHTHLAQGNLDLARSFFTSALDASFAMARYFKIPQHLAILDSASTSSSSSIPLLSMPDCDSSSSSPSMPSSLDSLLLLDPSVDPDPFDLIDFPPFPSVRLKSSFLSHEALTVEQEKEKQAKDIAIEALKGAIQRAVSEGPETGLCVMLRSYLLSQRNNWGDREEAMRLLNAWAPRMADHAEVFKLLTCLRAQLEANSALPIEIPGWERIDLNVFLTRAAQLQEKWAKLPSN